MAKIAIYNLSERELKDTEKIDVIARVVIKAILSIPRIGLKREDISFTFPRDFTGKSEKVSVAITEALFFRWKVTSQVRLALCQRVRRDLKPVLGREAKNISVEIKRPKCGY